MRRRWAALSTVTLIVALAGIPTLTSCAAGEGTGSGTVAIETTRPGNPLSGATIFSSSCASCHGADLLGIDGLGNQLAPNAFVSENSEIEVATLIGIGRSTSESSNTSGIDMPSRGGNPNLSDQDLRDVAAYLKGIQ